MTDYRLYLQTKMQTDLENPVSELFNVKWQEFLSVDDLFYLNT